MSWNKFSWLIIVLLIATIVWEILDLRTTYQKISAVKLRGTDEIDKRLASLQGRLTKEREHIDNLEKLALWSSEIDLASWLAQQASALNVQVIGMERLPAEDMLEYQRVTLNTTLRGSYNDLGRLVNSLERSPNPIKINSLRVRRREQTPGIIMDVSLSCFQKAG